MDHEAAARATSVYLVQASCQQPVTPIRCGGVLGNIVATSLLSAHLAVLAILIACAKKSSLACHWADITHAPALFQCA